MEMTRKGFYFSMDAVMALLIMSASMMLVMQLSDNASTEFEASSSEYQKIGTTGRDTIKLASAEPLNSLNKSLRQDLRPTVGEDAMEKSVLNGISLLWAKGNRSAASELVKVYFGNIIPQNYEYSVNITESANEYHIHRSKDLEGVPQLVTSTSTLVPGHEINRTSTEKSDLWGPANLKLVIWPNE